MIYFLLVFRLFLSISFLIDLSISKKIKINNKNNKIKLLNSKNCKFILDNLIKPLSMKVKKVKKLTDNVIINKKLSICFF